MHRVHARPTVHRGIGLQRSARTWHALRTNSAHVASSDPDADRSRTNIGQITPVRIALDRDDDTERYLWLDRPSRVETTDGDGVRIVTSARLQWDVIGIKVPITLRRVSALVVPSIVRRDGADVLAFCARIEQADLSPVPEFIEEPLIARVNEALTADHAQLVWAFTDTLDFHFQLPEMLDPQRALRLYARWGAVRTTREGIAIAASFALDAEQETTSAGLDQYPAPVRHAAGDPTNGRSDTLH